LGYGLPVDTALRSCLIGTALARGNVADGSALLEAAQRLQPDVIVVDLNLPYVHGLKACRQLKQVKKVDANTMQNRLGIRQRVR
jgi:CheY-like chemotaxis protein